MKHYLLIIRPVNCLFIAIAVLTGGILRSSIADCSSLAAAIVSAMLIAAGGYVINDFYDLPIDLVNRPRRILPQRKIEPDRAYLYAMFLFVFGFSLSFFTANPWAILIAIGNSLILYFYAKYIKRVVLISNIVVSYTTASAFLFGAIVCSNIRNITPLLIFTFLYTLTREIIKDAQDRKGDAQVGIGTLATIFGERKAVKISFIPSFLLLSALIISYSLQLISQTFFIVITLLYAIPLIVLYLRLFRDITTQKLYETSLLVKMHMLVLLVVLIFIH